MEGWCRACAGVVGLGGRGAVVQRKDRVDEVLEVARRWRRVLAKIRGHGRVSMWVEKRREGSNSVCPCALFALFGSCGTRRESSAICCSGASCKWLVDMLQCKAQGFVVYCVHICSILRMPFGERLQWHSVQHHRHACVPGLVYLTSNVLHMLVSCPKPSKTLLNACDSHVLAILQARQ